jgi:hypothetical protein
MGISEIQLGFTCPFFGSHSHEQASLVYGFGTNWDQIADGDGCKLSAQLFSRLGKPVGATAARCQLESRIATMLLPLNSAKRSGEIGGNPQRLSAASRPTVLLILSIRAVALRRAAL